MVAVGFIIGIFHGLAAASADDAFDPAALQGLNELAAIVGILIGGPAGLGVAAWQQSR